MVKGKNHRLLFYICGAGRQPSKQNKQLASSSRVGGETRCRTINERNVEGTGL